MDLTTAGVFLKKINNLIFSLTLLVQIHTRVKVNNFHDDLVFNVKERKLTTLYTL